MRLIAALVFAALLSGCASSRPVNVEPELSQKLKVRCVSNNIGTSGCSTEHTLILATTLRPDTGTLPSASDLQLGNAGESEF